MHVEPENLEARERLHQRVDLALDAKRRRRRAAPPRGHPARPANASARRRLGERHLDVRERPARGVCRPSPRARAGRRESRRDAVGDLLHLGQDVGREEHRAAARPVTSPTSSWNVSWTSGSSPLVGSSRTSRSGSCMNAWASPTFCRFPRDSSLIRRSRSRSRRAASGSPRRGSRSPKVAEVAKQLAAGHPLVEAEVAGEIADPPAITTLSRADRARRH